MLTEVMKGSRLVPAPNHGDGSRKASTHVKGKETFSPFNLPRARLSGQVLVGLVDLAHTGRSNRMAVANQAAPGVDRNFASEFAATCSPRTCGKAVAPLLANSAPFPCLGQAENFVSEFR